MKERNDRFASLALMRDRAHVSQYEIAVTRTSNFMHRGLFYVVFASFGYLVTPWCETIFDVPATDRLSFATNSLVQ